MTNLRKAAEMALEVMEYNRANGTPNMGAAMEALRQALAQPEQNELLKQGWRQCAVGQRTTQYCGMAEQARLEERKACWNILFDYAKRDDLSDSDESLLAHLADLIKARSEK